VQTYVQIIIRLVLSVANDENLRTAVYAVAYFDKRRFYWKIGQAIIACYIETQMTCGGIHKLPKGIKGQISYLIQYLVAAASFFGNINIKTAIGNSVENVGLIVAVNVVIRHLH